MCFLCPLIFVFFFFQGPGDPQHLHSFPTRRSSDLSSSPCTTTASTCSRRTPAPRAPSRSSDRKSTRLNSSHRTISYAVFCLKKKNRLECPQYLLLLDPCLLLELLDLRFATDTTFAI